MDRCMDVWLAERRNEHSKLSHIVTAVYALTDGFMDVRLAWWMDGWMDVWLAGWMHG